MVDADSGCRIAVLEPGVINQIAAGEVVERPASVVKELVENAVDAGASRIDVSVEGGGRGLIRVADDGCGMTPDEVALSLERHATSKLRAVDDLLDVQTMGFRGEALPSIASVSRLTIVSRVQARAEGFRIELAGGRRVRAEPAGSRPGTLVEVADLFHNTPARLKFLKRTATELAHVSEAIIRLALANPGVHLTLTLQGRRGLDLPARDDLLARARQVLGRRVETLLAATVREDGLEVLTGLSPPEQAVRSPRSVYVLVNRRAVRDRALVHAVVAGYGDLIERGRYPIGVVHVTIEGPEVDVNVHPQKHEVRFSEASRVFAVVRRCVGQALVAGDSESPGTGGAAPRSGARVYAIRTDASAARGTGYTELRARLAEATRRFWSGSAGSERVSSYDPDAAPSAGGGYFGALRVVGQALGTYLLCEGDDELVLVDQHAAHERIVFERLRAAVERGEAGEVPAQRLLVPLSVELEPALAAAAEEHAGTELRRLGFELDHFGGETWSLRAAPVWLADADPAGLVRDVLEELGRWGRSGRAELERERLLARMACHASVRGGQLLDAREGEALLRQLDSARLGRHCPHGRPVHFVLSRAELERRFGRT